ncbi:MAG: hypothetical protein ACXWBP_02520 [Limisphaerales bacterium]
MKRTCLLLLCAFVYGTRAQSAQPSNDAWTLDYRYAPASWQTAICLPDDWQKSLVDKDGVLLYDYVRKTQTCDTKIALTIDGQKFLKQELSAPRVPIVRTSARAGDIDIVQEAFAAIPQGGAAEAAKTNTPRHDVVIATFSNHGSASSSVKPSVTIETKFEAEPAADRRRIYLGKTTELFFPEPFVRVEKKDNKLTVEFSESSLAPGAKRQIAFSVAHGNDPQPLPQTLSDAKTLEKRAAHFWEKFDLPIDRIHVPDTNVQALLDSCVRNIYQAREIKNGLPAFQVGPTCYRGLWVVDGSFLLEAMTFLGRTNETRNGIKYLLNFQRDDGAWLLLNAHWKETGITLWAVARHAKLTNDKQWLRDVWPQVERGFAFIQKMRNMPPADALNARLIPDGFSDGGIWEKAPEYTNIYWTLAGMRAAIEAAHWIGNNTQADLWQKEYDDFYATFRRAAERDMHTDPHGNRYLPIQMRFDEKTPPQKAQWGFVHAVYPGQIFAPDDPLVRGNMAMLQAAEDQGLVNETGWLKKGIWTYFGSFYAHAWLWLGDGGKAARTLYAFANHASPLMVWREEQMPVGRGSQDVGDMPHNWASAEFIRLVRNSLVFERGNELHLFEAMPPTWARAGADVKLNKIVTEFGEISFDLHTDKKTKTATLKLTPPSRNPPKRIVVHLATWTGQNRTIEIPTDRSTTTKIELQDN